jgi:hypothetical protein
MAQPLVFDFYNSIITVPAPDTTLDMQYLINEIRDEEDELEPSFAYPKIADASGKESLGGGIFTAITVNLLNNWRVMFEARDGLEGTIQCTISGGNLVGGPGGNPVAPSAFTQVLNLSSAAGTIATPTTATETTNIQYLLATMNKKQKGIGSIFYWDPYSGNDSNTGLTPAAAVKTFAHAHTLVTTGAHDIIFALSSDPTGTTTVTEHIAITKPTLKLRGPGHVLQVVPTTSGDTVTISADNVEVSGFYISTEGVTVNNAITVNANSVLVKECWVENATGNGIDLASANLAVISDMVIDVVGTSGTGNGINLGNNTSQTEIAKCIISQAVDGIKASGTGVTDNLIENCLIFNNSAYGVDIGTGVTRTVLRSGNTYHKNTTAATHNLGIDTYIETQAGGSSPTEIATAVWDEVISSHLTPGTVGKTLKDAKTKATLASLK